MKIVVNFATERFFTSQKRLEKEAYNQGADKVVMYRPQDIDKGFIRKNYKILRSTRGAGNWLWKPYFILKTLKEHFAGDKVLYCDSGSYPINNLDHIYKILDGTNIVLFRLIDKLNRQWTKGDCFKLMNCDKQKYYDVDQTLGGFQAYNVCQEALVFLEEYLKYCCNYNIITDAPNLHMKNFGDFIDHRHDQSILTNLSVKNNIERFRDPSQFGNKQIISNSEYPQIFHLHRGNL